MSALLSYLAEKRQSLADNYQANCLAIACDIAQLLLDSRRHPFIVCLNKVEDRGEHSFHYPLIPKKYGGRVAWTKHYICCCGNMVYDPVLEEPVTIDDYCLAVFNEVFPMEKYVSEEIMKDYLRHTRLLQKVGG